MTTWDTQSPLRPLTSAVQIHSTLFLSFVQGRVLTITLHKIMDALLLLVGTEQTLHRLEQSDQFSFSQSEAHLRIMWEANCSCRAAGYPESSIEGLKATWNDSSTCSGLHSPMDVPTRSQAVARDSAAEVLRALREAVALVWPNHSADAAAAGAEGGRRNSNVAAYAEWEVLQAELLESAPRDFPALCDEGLWCCNPACTNLEGPSELALKTHACGGGCGVRYCSIECQAQGWRDGHRLSCGRLGDRRAAVGGLCIALEGGGAEHCHRAAATSTTAADG